VVKKKKEKPDAAAKTVQQEIRVKYEKQEPDYMKLAEGMAVAMNLLKAAEHCWTVKRDRASAKILCEAWMYVIVARAELERGMGPAEGLWLAE
jgi:hypothetical protein